MERSGRVSAEERDGAGLVGIACAFPFVSGAMSPLDE